jgi:hypothetical protein
MRILIVILLWISSLSLTPKEYSQEKSTDKYVWDFNTLEQWKDDSQQTNGKKNYTLLDNGCLKLFTHPKTAERSKIKSIQSFTTGTYTWKIFIPEIGKGDNSSIGAFLYFDDTHELDFEIGYGTKAIRKAMRFQSDELLVIMTSQGFPNCSKRVKIIRNQWYEFSLTLKKGLNNKLLAVWKINQTPKFSTVLHYKKKISFPIYCSVENLSFMGDHMPNRMNYALFDYVKFESNTK